jgi:hypothetical protein
MARDFSAELFGPPKQDQQQTGIDFSAELFGTKTAEPKTTNPFKGVIGRAAELAGSGIEAVAEVAERAGDYLEEKLPISGLSKEELKKQQLKPMFDWAKSLKDYNKDIGYAPSTKLGDLADNPLNAIPFIVERVITSSPDMAAAVVNLPAYVGARTKEILDERMKNDRKTLDDATIGDVTAAAGAAVLEGTLERFATKRVIGEAAKGATKGRRITKEGAVQAGTEAAEESAAYAGEAAFTQKGMSAQELAERALEGAIVGGGLGAGVQTGKEVFGKKPGAIEPPVEEPPVTPTAEPDKTVPPVTQIPAITQPEPEAVAPPSEPTAQPPVEPAAVPVEPVGIAKPPEGETFEPADFASLGTYYQGSLPDDTKLVLQNRDRTGQGSVAQMQKIASGPDYSRVGFSRDMASGAPIVISDFKIDDTLVGNTDFVTSSDGKRFPVMYAVVDAAGLTPSNSADGTRLDTYNNLDVQAIRPVAGNGRVAGLQEAYKRGTAEQYKQELVDDRSHGVNPESIQKLNNPVLVRVMPKSLVPANIGDISNVSGVAGLEPVDRAKNDLRRLADRFDIAGLNFNEDGTPQINTIRQFIEAMPESERTEMMNKKTGLPNPEAQDRLMNAIFYGAYQNDALIDLYAATNNPDAKMYLNTLAKVAPRMVKLAGAGDYDIRPQVTKAVENMVNAVRRGVPIRELPTYVQQGEIGLDPYTQQIMQLFADSGRSTKRIAEGLNRLADRAAEASRIPQTPDMFGEIPPRPSLDDVFGALKEPLDNQPDLFGETPKPEPTPEVEPELEPVKYQIDKSPEEIFREIKDMDMLQLSDWAVKNAPNAAAKEIATKVKERLEGIAKYKVPMNIKILSGDGRNQSAIGKSRYRYTKTGMQMTIQLNGLRGGKADSLTGTKYRTILHELVHAATQAQTHFIGAKSEAVAELNELFETVKRQVRADLKNKVDHPILDKIRRGANTIETRDELLAWGTTDGDFQDYLLQIKVGDTNAFGKLVEIIRKIIGVSKTYGTALESLMKTTDTLLSEPIDNIAQAVIKSGKTMMAPMPRSMQRREVVGEVSNEMRQNVFGQPMPQSSWGIPDDSKFDSFRFTLQDKMIDTRRVVENIGKAIGNIKDRWNPYLQEELYHGRTAKQVTDFLNQELKPLVDNLKKRGVTLAQLEEYLQNRHAEERNVQVAKVNPNMPDGGSGILTADARAYLAKLTPEQVKDFQSLAAQVDAITKQTRRMLVQSGLESQDTIDAWENAYKNYVPLAREESDYELPQLSKGIGQGFNVRGQFSKRAAGSARTVVDILANVAMQRERAIVRAEKNRVSQALFGLAVQNPNPQFWLAIDPKSIQDPAAMVNDLISMGINPADAQNIAQEPTQTYVDPVSNKVVERPNPLLRGANNVLATRVNGSDKFIFFNPQEPRALRMVEALKNLDADQLSRGMSIIGKVTRYFASINTQYNPIFGVINFLRDVQGAMIQVSDTPVADKRGQILSDTYSALRGIYSDLRAERSGKQPPNTQWSQLWQEFQVEGGQTGFRDMYSHSEQRAEALAKMIDPSNWANSPLGKVFTANGTLKVPMETARKTAAPLFDWLSDYNQTMENAIRLATYKAALDKGLSKQQAASVAKNITVNFNRKGQIAKQAGALYAFFNAAVQGSARMFKTLKGPTGKKIMLGGLVLGSSQAMILAAFGFDENEPPEFIKEKNFVIPTGGGGYITIPMPLGYNVIPNTSRIITEWTLSGFRDTPKRVASLTGAILDAFNPLGNAGWSMQTFTPTVADPIVALGENKDWTGKPIAKKDMSSLDPTPGYTRAKDTASWFSKELSYFLNMASGGTKYKPGVISPTPDQIDYLIGQATGGVGRELMKTEQTARSMVTGEELPTYKIPLAGRFYGSTQSQSAERDRFYENIKKINEHENEIKGRAKNRENVQEYLRENPEARLYTMANNVERSMTQLRRRRQELIKNDAPKEEVQRIEKMMTDRMRLFNERVRQAEETRQ